MKKNKKKLCEYLTDIHIWCIFDLSNESKHTAMTKSEIFKAAHAVAKNLVGDYKACFVMALAIVRDQKQHIQFVKNIILNDTNKVSRLWVDGEAREGFAICYTVAKFTTGFGSQVATTVDKYGKASEKQAYVIARAFVEAGAEAGIMAAYKMAA